MEMGDLSSGGWTLPPRTCRLRAGGARPPGSSRSVRVVFFRIAS